MSHTRLFTSPRLTHPDRALSRFELSQLEHWSEQLYQHVPIAYLCGNQEFWGLSLVVDHRVLVPRPDTETLVEQALVCLNHVDHSLPTGTAPTLLDLGTGSGAIALALASERPDADIHACDCSLESLAVARKQRLIETTGDLSSQRLVREHHSALPCDCKQPSPIAPDDPISTCSGQSQRTLSWPKKTDWPIYVRSASGPACFSKPMAGCCWSMATIKGKP